MPNFFETQRKAIKKTQFQLAVEIGKTPSAIAAWERDEAKPKLKDAAIIAKAYRVSEKKITDVIVELSKADAPGVGAR